MLTNDVCPEGEGNPYKDLAMYTVPAKVPNKAKDLIATFEKGEASQNSEEPTTNGDVAVVTTNGDPTSPGATVRIRMSREVSLDELAQPGTARRLLQEFETRVQQAVAAGVEPPILRNPNSKAAAFFRNSRSSVASDDQSQSDQVPAATDASTVAEQVPQPISEVAEPQCNGETDVVVTSETAEIPSPPPPTAAAAAEVAAVEPTVVETAAAVDVATAESTANSGVTQVDVDVAAHSETNHVESASDNTASCAVDVAAKTVLVVSALREKTPLAESLLQLFHNSQHKLLLSDVISGNIAADEERQKLEAADLVVIHFQPVFNCVPASLQGWFETVFASGQTLGSNKTCVVILTTTQQQEDSTSTGALSDLEASLRPLQNGLLRQVGFNVLQPQIIYNETSSDLSDVIDQWSARLENIWNEHPVISP